MYLDFLLPSSSTKVGRRSEYISEEILRSLVVMFLEQDSYREVVVRIENSDGRSTPGLVSGLDCPTILSRDSLW